MPSVGAFGCSTDVWWDMYWMVFEVDVVSNTGIFYWPWMSCLVSSSPFEYSTY